MSIKPEYLKLFVNATEKAAYGASKFIGKNDKVAADQAAVDNMRNEFNIPVLLHTHVLPDVRFDVDTQTENFKQVAGQADTVSFISEYNIDVSAFFSVIFRDNAIC